MENLDSDIPNDGFSCLWPDQLWDGDNLRSDSLHQAKASGASLPAMNSTPQENFRLEPHCQEGLVKEAEGLFVGVNLLNEMEPLEDTDILDLPQEYSAKTEVDSDFICDWSLLKMPWSISQDERRRDAQISFDAEIKKTNLEIYGKQLNILRILRAKFIVHHRKFLQRTVNEPLQGVQELRRSCRRYKDLLDVGLLTFKAIMAGEHPSTLKEIFAFISLSFAMVSTMQACGKSVEFYLSRWETSKWGANIGDENDCFTLLRLIPLLWPEVEDPIRRDNPFSVSDEAWEGFSRGMFTENRLISELGDKSFMYSTACRLLCETSADDDFCFSDWLNLVPVDDTTGFQDNKFSEKFLQTNPLSDPSPEQRLSNSQSDAAKTDWPGDMNTSEQISGLAQTALFMQAITFLIFIGGLGALLFYLSAINQTGSSTGTYTFTTANTAKFSRLLEVAKYRILNPLCLDKDLSEFHPLFRTTIKVLEAGWLRTIRDIEIYLLSILKLFANCQVSYLSAVSKILACAFNASQDERIDHECIYQEGHQEINDYNAEYISRRTSEEAAIFAEEVAVLTQYATGFDTSMNDGNESSVEVEIVDPESFNQKLASGESPEHQNPSVSLNSTAENTTSGTPPHDSIHITLPSMPPRATLNQHTVLHCPISGCSKKYTGPDSRSNLARHKREQHSNRTAFSCTAPGCGHVSKRLHNLKAHWRLRHVSLTMPDWLGRGRLK